MMRDSDGNGHDSTSHLQPLVDDDAFLTALSHGEDPSGGRDPLAALLLELREDAYRQMPAAPAVQGSGHRRRPHPLVAGLIGAAAATAIVAGSGAALYNATPGSPLWGASTAVFGDRTSVVELASTLDELEVASEKGDAESTRNLLNQARALVGALGTRVDPAERAPAQAVPGSSVQVTVTETVHPEVPAPAQPPESVPPATEPAATVTQTVTVTKTVTEPAPLVTATTPASEPTAPELSSTTAEAALP
ncbi:hypothetical protein [Corynebacterium lipophiloflavum]|uniref:Anti-sigma-D factor RsdA sigma factor binding region domain-containing protein n=1 Tax=Corynebacterium lipophiloflavum (strain ATCC 700352 / DSM 44291 / CCUG 37336 / JCM 10383 / DMMZ 1944) TaxID=525263 RepID=C0XUU6_CORLD|nr:hypothetical protein [Corynebacterium lipophiloflavum]EEI15962.1 hypothetical protein HMPREF0298_2216 [Corynebacterium lipophiloflavum DSM 44291]